MKDDNKYFFDFATNNIVWNERKPYQDERPNSSVDTPSSPR
jgi:hypothetical protein